MWVWLALAAMVTAVQVDHGSPDTRVEGILEMPELFGTYACEQYDAQPVPVYRSPGSDSERAGTIRVRTPYVTEAGGPCQEIQVEFVQPESAVAESVPLREYGYEEIGLEVIERDAEWFRVRLASTDVWIGPYDADRFHGYAYLVSGSLAHLTKHWSGELADSARGGRFDLPEWERQPNGELTVEVIGYREVEDELWFHVRLDPDYGCVPLSTELVPVEGWVPGYDDGRNVLWFSSRGC